MEEKNVFDEAVGLLEILWKRRDYHWIGEVSKILEKCYRTEIELQNKIMEILEKINDEKEFKEVLGK